MDPSQIAVDLIVEKLNQLGKVAQESLKKFDNSIQLRNFMCYVVEYKETFKADIYAPIMLIIKYKLMELYNNPYFEDKTLVRMWYRELTDRDIFTDICTMSMLKMNIQDLLYPLGRDILHAFNELKEIVHKEVLKEVECQECGLVIHGEKYDDYDLDDDRHLIRKVICKECYNDIHNIDEDDE